MHKLLELDLRAVQAELRKRDFLRSSDVLGSTDDVFRAREHGYRRIDEFTSLHVLNFEAGQSYSLSMARADLVCIQVIISGAYSRWVRDRSDLVNPSTIQITNFPRSVSETHAGAKLRGVLIICEREYILEHFRLNVDAIPAPYRPIFRSRTGMVEALKLPTSPMIMACADQILSCKYQEPMRGIYIRAKTAEIICDVIAALNLLSLRRTPHAAGPRRKASAIETAAEIYKREIDNPPTIEQLAFRVGLNRNELTTGFRDLFGATPHAYGHMLRMKQAQSLLLEGELSISEIARRVGYEGYSSFSRAYHSHYGRAPSLEADPVESVPSVLGTLRAGA